MDFDEDGSSGRGYVRLSNRRQLHYRYARGEVVTRRPLICLHCTPMASRIFEALLPLIAQDRLAIAFDTPGYGNSDRADPPASIAGYAAAIVEALQAMDLRKVDLFGYHTGSAIALELARKQPRLVDRIVINSALMFEEKERLALSRFKEKAEASVAQQASELTGYWAFWRDFWKDIPSDEAAWPLFLDSLLLPKGQFDGFFAAYAYDFSHALQQTRHPLLIFNPSDDLYEVTERARPVLPPSASIKPLPGWTHGFLHAHAGDVADHLRAFLDL